METYWRGHEERWAAIFSPWLLLSMFVLVIKPVLTLSSVSVLVSVFAKEFFKCLFKQWWSALRGKYSNWSVKPWLLQDDVMHVIMCKISLEKTCDWGESGCQISGEPCIFLNQNSYTCKQPCRALFSQKLIFWKPSKRHLIFKWADRWKRVNGGGGGGDVLIDGPMARSGVWIYEPEQIWILRTLPSCHTGHIKNYLTMHYVGDLSRKKDEHALPVRLKLQPAVQWGVAPTLSILYGPL